MTSSLYLPPYHENGVTASTPGMEAISAIRAYGTGRSNPCELITMIRLKSLDERVTSPLIVENEIRTIASDRLTDSEAMVRNERIGLRRAFRKTMPTNFMRPPPSWAG